MKNFNRRTRPKNTRLTTRHARNNSKTTPFDRNSLELLRQQNEELEKQLAVSRMENELYQIEMDKLLANREIEEKKVIREFFFKQNCSSCTRLREESLHNHRQMKKTVERLQNQLAKSEEAAFRMELSEFVCKHIIQCRDAEIEYLKLVQRQSKTVNASKEMVVEESAASSATPVNLSEDVFESVEQTNFNFKETTAVAAMTEEPKKQCPAQSVVANNEKQVCKESAAVPTEQKSKKAIPTEEEKLAVLSESPQARKRRIKQYKKRQKARRNRAKNQ